MPVTAILSVCNADVKCFKWLGHCVKGVRIRSFPGLHFPAFRLNTEQSECGKIRNKKTTNTATFHAVGDSCSNFVKMIWSK